MIDIMKCAEELQDYCRSRKECKGCIFFRSDGCTLCQKMPDEWNLEDKEDSFDEEWVKWLELVKKRSKDSDKDEWDKQEEGFRHYAEIFISTGRGFRAIAYRKEIER